MASPKEWAQVIAKAWLDEEFKSLLEKDPVAAFEQCGIETDVILRVPNRPDDLSDETLESIVESDRTVVFALFTCSDTGGGQED